MNEIKIIIIGKGNVGSSLLDLIVRKRSYFNSVLGFSLKIIAIFEYDGALIDEDGLNIEKIINSKMKYRDLDEWKYNLKAIDLISKLDFNICIETTPTNPEDGEPALSHIFEALKNKKDVITSNKAPFYLKYKEIHDLAKKNKCQLKYEATVASCVPCLTISDYLLANEIISIKGILNGTSNYILSRMTSEGVEFSLALKEAQELGYAEANPTLDIEGYDAAGKLVILANKFLEYSNSIRNVDIQGISKITPQVIELAKTDGYFIKHLAIAENGKLIVEPRLIKRDSPLNINGTLNVIEFETKFAGSIVLMGRGAGGYEAASAILNDLICIIRNKKFN